MVKRNTKIGFKACANHEEDEEENNQSESHINPEEIEDNVRDQIGFQEHMKEFEGLQATIKKYKTITYIILAILITFIVFRIGYKNGAWDQAKGDGPYTVIIENNVKHISTNSFTNF